MTSGARVGSGQGFVSGGDAADRRVETATAAHSARPAVSPLADASQPAKRSASQILKSYFYWTYTRGSMHYDVMVTLILLFIFVTPWLWDYGDKPASTALNTQPVLVMGDGGHGLIVTVEASDVNVPAASPDRVIKKALKKAMEPVLGDSVYVERWQLTRDHNGNPTSWKVWAHR